MTEEDIAGAEQTLSPAFDRSIAWDGKSSEAIYSVCPSTEYPGFFWVKRIGFWDGCSEEFAKPISAMGLEWYIGAKKETISWTPANTKPAEPARARFKSSSRKSVVYFIHAVGTSFVKIGHGRDRIESFRCGCPFALTILAEIETTNAPKMEKELHDRFAKHRHRGEWFRLSGDLDNYIKELRS